MPEFPIIARPELSAKALNGEASYENSTTNLNKSQAENPQNLSDIYLKMSKEERNEIFHKADEMDDIDKKTNFYRDFFKMDLSIFLNTLQIQRLMAMLAIMKFCI